ncbi:hypothetical protein V8918_02745 [Ralstonia mannitolilytica]|uniref:hypothetical protein n=1 Tax=Ralstonia mannitolilytica TaxID=105219 RepID=UPI003B83CE85
MNTKHTPGEWSESTYGGKTWIQTEEQHKSSGNKANDGYCIAQFFGPDAIANAQLASVSPKLLDFVAEYLDAWHSGMAGDSSMRRLAESLFEKATGASHVHDQ